MKLISLSKNSKLIIVITFHLLIILLSIIFYFLDNYHLIEDLKRKNETLKQEINKANQIISRIDQLKNDNAKLNKEMETKKFYLPQDKEVNVLLRKLTILGISNNLDITLWTPKEFYIHQSQELYEIPIEVKLRGRYSDLITFFSMFESLDRIVSMKNMYIRCGNYNSTSTDKPFVKNIDPTNLFVSLSLTTFSLIPENEKKQIKEKGDKK